MMMLAKRKPVEARRVFNEVVEYMCENLDVRNSNSTTRRGGMPVVILGVIDTRRNKSYHVRLDLVCDMYDGYLVDVTVRYSNGTYVSSVSLHLNEDIDPNMYDWGFVGDHLTFQIINILDDFKYKTKGK